MADPGAKTTEFVAPTQANGGLHEHRLPSRPVMYDKKVALVLQGGGVLGSYQAGVYEALSTSQYLPDWVAGVSIGAINAAIIAGNAPQKRVERLKAFWEEITAPSSLRPVLSSAKTCDHRRTGSLNALMFGQPGFSAPRPAMHWLFGVTGFYDTSALKNTLKRLIDFDRINAREIRFSVTAVNVRTGNLACFDNAEITIGPEHVMASAALPPASRQWRSMASATGMAVSSVTRRCNTCWNPSHAVAA